MLRSALALGLASTLVACGVPRPGSSSQASAGNDSVLAQTLALAPTPADKAVLETFFALAEIARPSGKEDRARAHLVQIADEVNARVGRDVIRYETDPKGNILFRLEGTGRYAGDTAPVVTLQGHLDMVWAVSNVAPGTSLAPYFEDGVRLALDDGWLRSAPRVEDGVERTTSIGADNGVGVSMAARFMRDFEAEHPAMALLFTVGEEAGLQGVREFGLTLPAPVLVNVDAFFVDTFIYGCLGNARAYVDGKFAGVALPAGYELLTLRVQGLRGGHSGHDIAKPRLNAVLTTLKLASAVTAAGLGEVRIVGAKAGDMNALGAIPTGAEITLAVPAERVQDATRLAEETFQAALAAAGDENPATARLEAVREAAPAGAVALDAGASRRFQDAVLAVKNGPISHWEVSPTGVNSSSNLGGVTLAPAPEGDGFVATGGFMARSYVKAELDQVIADNQAALGGWDGATPRMGPYTHPWIGDVEGAFYQLARQTLPGFRLALTGGTNELAVLTGLFPDVTMVSMGPQIQDAHSPGEKIRLDTIFSTNAALQALVKALGEAQSTGNQ